MTLRDRRDIRIAVIGGGVGAVSLLDSLLETFADARQHQRRELSIYEPDPSRLAHGLAFAPDLDSAIVNLPNQRMTIRDRDCTHFLRWLNTRPEHSPGAGGDSPATSFATRQVFGSYLDEQFDRCLKSAADQGWQVRIHHETVLSVSDGADGGYVLHTSESAREHTHAVLAIGPGSPADPFDLVDAPGFLESPYPLKTVLPQVDPKDHVVILGTGLTAIDVALGLLYLGHQGPLTMTSRHGILPQISSGIALYEMQYLTAPRIREYARGSKGLYLADLWNLFKGELTAAGFDADAELSWLLPESSPMDHLRHQLRNPDANPVRSLFQNVPNELKEVIRSLLIPQEQEKIRTDYRTHLKSLQCPMPSTTARTLLSAMESGQLSIVPGVTGVRLEGSRFHVTAQTEVPPGDTVIDATKTSPAESKGAPGKLMSALTRDGYASWDYYGGLRVSRRTNQLHDPTGPGTAAGRTRGLYAMGELTSGSIYYASSLPAVNEGADIVAAAIALDQEFTSWS